MKRPGVVTFIVLLLIAKATIAAVGAVIAFAAMGSQTAADLGLSDNDLLIAGIADIIVLLLFAWAALWMSQGHPSARTFTGAVVVLRIGLTVLVMLTHHDGGYVWSGFFSLLASVFILWALYGNERSDEYFSQA